MAEITVIPDSDPQRAAGRLASTINLKINQGSRVLWLLSGGSAIQLAKETSKLLIASKNGLTIGLIDERYGPVGHHDSNWQQLIEAGIDLQNSKCLPILNDQAFEQTIDSYAAELSRAVIASDTIIGLFGMGSDGHTAGILPGIARAYSVTDLVIGYSGHDYERITISPAFFAKIDQAILYANGESKRAQLIQFMHEDTDPVQQPVQYLKQVKQLTVMTDQEGIL